MGRMDGVWPAAGKFTTAANRSAGPRSRRFFYSLCETCKRLGVDAEQYLAAVARADIASPGAVLMPHQFAAMQNA